jgi:hypothetical protein
MTMKMVLHGDHGSVARALDEQPRQLVHQSLNARGLGGG